MRKIIVFIVLLGFIVGGCFQAEPEPEFLPLLKHGDFYIGINAVGETAYIDFDNGVLILIGTGRTALEKYKCNTPKLLATVFDWNVIVEAGEQQTGVDGFALGNLYITETEIIVFGFADLSVIERIPLKIIGVTRIGNYDVFVEKLYSLKAAINDASDYLVTIDTKENPVLYKDDRIVYFEGEQVYIKNVTGLYEDPVSFLDYYEKFLQDQSRVELLRRSNNIYNYSCVIFKENLCFISDSGHLSFSR